MRRKSGERSKVGLVETPPPHGGAMNGLTNLPSTGCPDPPRIQFADIVGERMKLKADGGGGERTA